MKTNSIYILLFMQLCLLETVAATPMPVTSDLEEALHRGAASPSRKPSKRPIETLAPSHDMRNSYSIDVRYTPGSAEAGGLNLKSSVQRAAQRWETVIANDINSTYLYKAGASCSLDSTVLPNDIVVDDLLIFIDTMELDGEYGMLGRSGPCILSTTGGTFSRVGLMQLDTADIPILFASGALDAMILHEVC
jgi:hypothetical protein